MKTKPQKGDLNYHRLWRIIDGAVADALNSHPDYFSHGRRYAIQQSIVKRVTGSVIGFASEQAKGRSGVQSSG